jgi:hypothetical protein
MIGRTTGKEISSEVRTCAQRIPQRKQAESAKQICLLIEEIDRRLTLSKEDVQVNVDEDPFSLYAEEVSLHLQLEVTELQYLAVSRNKDRGRIL